MYAIANAVKHARLSFSSFSMPYKYIYFTYITSQYVWRTFNLFSFFKKPDALLNIKRHFSTVLCNS